jgi:hypothetical protein
MCWSAKVSLNTFLLSAFAIWLAWLNGYPIVLLLFVLAYASMQLVEYVVWQWGLGNSRINTVASIVGSALILVQPLASVNLIRDTRLRKYFMFGYAGFLVLNLMSYVLSGPSERSKFKTTVAENGHLRWQYVSVKRVWTWTVIAYMFLLLTPLLITPEYRWMFVFAAITFAASMYTYAHHKTWGSMWCWMLNALSLGLIFKIVFYDHLCAYLNK